MTFPIKKPRAIFPSVLLALLAIIIISSLLAFFIAMPLISQAVSPTIRTNLTNAANTANRIHSVSGATAQELAEYITSPTTVAKAFSVDDAAKLGLTEEDIAVLNEGSSVFKPLFHALDSYMVIKIDDSYIKLSMAFNTLGFASYRKAATFTLIICFLISTIIITVFVKRFTSPLTMLSKATNEIAKGNFDVNISADRQVYNQSEMSQLISNFNRMAKELSQNELMRKDFINSVSHEFKTPIASISGFASMLKKDNLTDEEREEFTNIIISESKRLTNLSTNILKLARLDSVEFVDKTKTYSLDEQLRNCVLILEPKWSQKNIEFDIELDEVEIAADEELLTQAWINLLDNAIKFTPQNGEIKVLLKKENEKIIVTIADNGMGMDKSTQARLFEMFYQGDTNHASEGNGLGLAIVKRIIDLSGGKIEVWSEPQKGSKFTITFS